MLLTKPTFKVSFFESQVIHNVQELLGQKGWSETDYSLESPTLIYLPVWIFSFDIFHEKELEEKKQKIINKIDKGSGALDSTNRELNDFISEISKQFTLEKIREPEIENFEVKKSSLKKEEAEKIITIKLAHKFKLAKENVIITGLKEIYFPIWILRGKLNNHEISFNFDAIKGTLLSNSNLPERGKSLKQTTMKTLNDLQKPNKWLEYFQTLAKIISSNFVIKNLWNNNQLKLIILLVLVLILLLSIFGYL